MNNKEALYDLIERHIQSELTDEEAKQVEELRAKDPSFAHEIEIHKDIHYALADKDLHAFKQILTEADKTYFTSIKTTPPEKRVVPFYLKIAATITLVIGLSATLYFIKTTAVTKDNLFDTYFSPYDAPVNFRSSNSPYVDNDLKQALTFYDEGKYQNAIPYLNRVVTAKPENRLALLLRGVSYLASGNTAKAELDFNTIIQHQQNMFVDQATWYLALTYLRQGKKNDARSVLHTLENSSYHNKVQELLLELDR